MHLTAQVQSNHRLFFKWGDDQCRIVFCPLFVVLKLTTQNFEEIGSEVEGDVSIGLGLKFTADGELVIYRIPCRHFY